MGCACSERESDSEPSVEEKIIKSAVEVLELDKLKASDYDKGVSRFAIDNKLTDKNFKHAYESLSLSTSFLNDENSPLFRFYENFKDFNTYEIRKLVCLGIWLGNDMPKTKAHKLFENYDRDCSNNLDRLEIQCMLDDMIQITQAIIKLAEYAYPYKTIILQTYSRKLKRSQDLMKKYLPTLIFRGETDQQIGLNDFVEEFSDSVIKKMLSDQGFRELLIECNELKAQANLNI